MLHLTPDTARALLAREALYTDGPEGREPWAACAAVECGVEMPVAALRDGFCPGCDRQDDCDGAL